MAWYSGLGGLNALGGALGQLGLGAASQGIGGAISGAFAKKQRKEAYKLWRKQTRMGPSFAVEGMRRAGLNPILALGKGGGIGGNVGLAGQTQLDTKGVGTARDLVEAGPSARLTQQQTAQSKKQVSLMGAQIDMVTAQSAQARAAAQNQLAQALKAQTQQGMEQWWLNAAQGLSPAAQQQLFMQKQGGPWGAGLGVLQGAQNLGEHQALFPLTPKSRGLQFLLNKILQPGHSAGPQSNKFRRKQYRGR